MKKVERQPKNVIIMVMDGTSSSATTLARLYKGKPLALDEIVTGRKVVHIRRNQL
ncbi:hypothetical protein ACT7CZ_30525 [Bacillus cereus]